MYVKLKIRYLFLTLSILSCANDLRSKKIIYRNYYVKGDITFSGKDTVFNGPIEYYDKEGDLMSIINFKENSINGKAIDFYKNGKPKQEEEYSCGVKNGITKAYDSSGRIISEINFFAGLVAGRQIVYKSDSSYFYKFVNLEDWPLYSCRYENNQAIENGNLLNYFTHYKEIDGIMKLELFIYLIDPPHKKLTYELYDKDIKKNDSTIVHSFTQNLGFFQKIQLDIPKENHKYFFQVESFYPTENVRIKDVLKAYQKELRLPDTIDDSK